MPTLTFFSGDSGDNGDNSRNSLRRRGVGVPPSCPRYESTTGDTGDKIGVCPRLSPVKKTGRGQTSKPQPARGQQVGKIVPIVPAVPAKKHHSRKHSGDL